MFSVICETVPLNYVGFLNQDTRNIFKIMEYLIKFSIVQLCIWRWNSELFD